MTLSEFKAWFEGFTESIEGAPTEAQFAKIKDKVGKIDGAPVTYPIFVDRYWPAPLWQPSVPPLYPYTVTLDAVAQSNGIGVCNFEAYAPNTAYGDKGEAVTTAFDSHAAMRDLGRAEAMN